MLPAATSLCRCRVYWTCDQETAAKFETHRTMVVIALRNTNPCLRQFCLLGFHKPLLGLLGAYLVWKLITQGPLPMQQVPHAVLYLALAIHFPGIDSGILGRPSAPGLNAYVVTDLMLAALLVGVALDNHQVLTKALGTHKVQDELRG